MNFRRIFHRTSFKHKLIFCVCLAILYIFVFHDSPLMSHIKIRLLSFGNYTGDEGRFKHQLGQFVTGRNGSFMYFHLPSLVDFDIERDFYRLNSFGAQANNDTMTVKYCLRRGADMADMSGHNRIFCVCKSNYTGNECAIPPLVHQTVDQKVTSTISRLGRPRRIVVSLIWPTYEFVIVNVTSKEMRLHRFAQTLDTMAQFVDLFVIHEIRFVSNASVEDQHSLEYQFKKGPLAKHAMYSLLYSNTVAYNQASKTTIDFEKLEFEMVRKSWQVLTTRVTEYRPADFLIFLSVNNFPSEPLLLYLKYHTGLMDIVHFQPIRQFTLRIENGSVSVSSSIDHEATNSKVNSFLAPSNSEIKVQLASQHWYHLKNVIFTFEFLSYLCRYSFESFFTNYCLTDKPLVDRFEKNFWPIRLVSVGNEKLNHSATFSIL